VLQNISEANGQVSFTPVNAPSLGTPTQIWLITADTVAHQRVVLIYDHPTYGRFIVDEATSETDQATLESMTACTPVDSCPNPPWQIQTLSDGARGVLITGSGSNGIMWLESQNTVLMDVYGPPDAFSTDSATAVANALETQT
jgi:hypothetical protein